MMRQPFILRKAMVAALAAGLVLTGALFAPAQADDAPPSGFPSWQDVETAKGDAAATEKEVANITRLLDGLEKEAGALGDVAVKAGGNYALTQQKLDAATAQANLLGAQAARAAEKADKYKKAAVAVAVQSYKSGGAGLGMFATLSALESDQGLNSMEMLHQAGERATRQQDAALESQAVATSLEKNRKAAADAQSELVIQAQAAKDQAVQARDAVTAQLDAKKQQNSTLLAQLAALKNTTAQVEQAYRQGQAAQAAYEQVHAAKEQAAAEEAARRAAEQQPSQPDPAPQPQPPVNPVPPPPIVPPAPDPGPGVVVPPELPSGAVNDPAGAKAYAQARLGSFGWNLNEFQCLNLLWERESNWRTTATNPYSGAYGIAQALPASKYGETGSNDWLSNYRTQVDWGLGYIRGRYGSPCGAWAHSEAVGWY